MFAKEHTWIVYTNSHNYLLIMLYLLPSRYDLFLLLLNVFDLLGFGGCQFISVFMYNTYAVSDH